MLADRQTHSETDIFVTILHTILAIIAIISRDGWTSVLLSRRGRFTGDCTFVRLSVCYTSFVRIKHGSITDWSVVTLATIVCWTDETLS